MEIAKNFGCNSLRLYKSLDILSKVISVETACICQIPRAWTRYSTLLWLREAQLDQSACEKWLSLRTTDVAMT